MFSPTPASAEDRRLGGQRDDEGLVRANWAPERPPAGPATMTRLTMRLAAHDAAPPNRPVGRQISTTRHQDVDQHRGQRRADRLGACGVHERARTSSAAGTRPSVSVSPTSSAPTSAPLIEPIPPMTMTTKARISTGSPMPTCTDWIGADQRAGQPGKRRAEREDDRVEPVRCRRRAPRSSRGRLRRRGCGCRAASGDQPERARPRPRGRRR